MPIQRLSQQSIRRMAVHRPFFGSLMTTKQMVYPMILWPSKQTRPVTTQSIKQSESIEILVAQRKNRPTSPHLSIYRPQITWYLSALNRITGCTISAGFYVFGAAYLVSPIFGWHLDSSTLASVFVALPPALKLGIKSFVAFPFAFHCINGVRHLIWDFGKAFTNQAVIKTGWTVVGLSVASTFALVALV